MDSEIVNLKVAHAQAVQRIEHLERDTQNAWMHINDIKKDVILRFRHLEDDFSKKINDLEVRLAESQRQSELRLAKKQEDAEKMFEKQQNRIVKAISGVGAVIVIAIAVLEFLLK